MYLYRCRVSWWLALVPVDNKSNAEFLSFIQINMTKLRYTTIKIYLKPFKMLLIYSPY